MSNESTLLEDVDLDNSTDSIVEQIKREGIRPVSFKLAIPMIIGNFTVLIYNLVDSLFVAGIDKGSTAYVSAVGLIAPIYLLALAISNATVTGISALLAKEIGAERWSETRKVANMGLIVSLVLGMLLGIFCLTGVHRIVEVLSGTEVSALTKENASAYFIYLIPGLIVLIISQVFSGILQAQGLTKYIGISMLMANAVNLILDPLFIYGLRMGTKGAALGTSLSIIIGTVYLYIQYNRNSKIKISFKDKFTYFRKISDILKVGVPVFLISLMSSLALMYLNNKVGSISEFNLNAWILVGRFDQLVVMIGTAFASATITMVGQCYGNKDYHMIRNVLNNNIKVSLLLGIVMIVLYNIIAYLLFSIFTNVPEVLEASVRQVRLLSVTYLGAIVLLIVSALFQATEKAGISVLLNVFIILLIQIPGVFILSKFFDFGIYSIYLTIIVTNIAALIIALISRKIYLNKFSEKNT